MRGLWSSWVALLSIREPATSLARFRIAVGLVILYSLLSMIVAGLVEVMWIDFEYGGLQTLSTRHWLVGLLGGRTPSTAWILVGGGLLLGGLLTVGLGGRLTALVALQFYYALTSAKPTLAGGYDTLITNALWLLVFAESTATLSLDCRLRTGRWRSDRPVPAWPRYLFMMQLAALYCTTGSVKTGSVWKKGDALYYALNMDHFYRFEWLTQQVSAVLGTNLFRLNTWVTHWWEMLFPVTLVGVVLGFTVAHRDQPWYRAQDVWWRRWGARALWVAIWGLLWRINYLVLPFCLQMVKDQPQNPEPSLLKIHIVWGIVIPAFVVAWYALGRWPVVLLRRGRALPWITDRVPWLYIPELHLSQASLRAWLLGRRTWLTIGCLFHGALIAFMNIGMFPFIMLMTYAGFFSGEEHVRVWRFCLEVLRKIPGLRRLVPRGYARWFVPAQAPTAVPLRGRRVPDVLVLVLDATQLLNRTEMAFLRDAVSAVGGLAGSGARLLLAINRIDLVEEGDRPQLVEYLQREVRTLAGEGAQDAIEIFQTDSRGALRRPDEDSPGIEQVHELRARLLEIAEGHADVLPARARAALARHASLLAHNAAIAARALTLEELALRREIRAIEREVLDHESDLVVLREQLAAGQATIQEQSEGRIDRFRDDLRASTIACIDAANLRLLSHHLPGSLHDAFLAFAHEESERLRVELDELTRQAMRTHGEQARRRLFQATMRLGFRGPPIYVDPPSVVLEASLVFVGLVGTAVMYFGSLVAGLAMTVAGPLATVFLREKSLREARERAKAELPGALERASEALRDSIRRVVEQHVSAVEEHLVLANVALGRQLVSVLEQARERLGQDDAPDAEDRRRAAQTRMLALEQQLYALRQQLRP